MTLLLLTSDSTLLFLSVLEASCEGDYINILFSISLLNSIKHYTQTKTVTNLFLLFLFYHCEDCTHNCLDNYDFLMGRR